MKPKPTHADLADSRYLTLQRLARAQKRATAELLQLYVLESFLCRLIRSRHDERLVLKGGLLLAAFDLRRATRDVDLLAMRTDNDPALVERLVVEIASVDVDDGVVILHDTITAGSIRDEDVYPGVRAVIEALRAVASHRGVVLQPLGAVLAGMPKEAQARWVTWRERQGAQERVPADFAAVLDELEERTRAWISEAAKAGGPRLSSSSARYRIHCFPELAEAVVFDLFVLERALGS